MQAYMIYQTDIHFSTRILFGIFTKKKYDRVVEIMMDGFEKLYPGFKADVYPIGQFHWVSDKHDFGVEIVCVDLNVFDEL